MMRRALLILATALPTATLAQQYRSEVRELPTPPAEQTASPETLLKTTTDPYQRALLLRDLAAQAAREGNNQKALEYLNQALATNALSGIAAEQMREMQGQLLLGTGAYKQMQGQLEAQVRQGNATPEIKVALAAAYLEDKRYRDALPLLRDAVKAVPDADISWRRALMASLLGTGAHREALPLLEALLREDPRQGEDWLRLAALHLKLGNKARAAAVMEVAQRLGFLQSPEDRLRLVSLVADLGAPFESGSLLKAWMEDGTLADNVANRRFLAQLWLAAREASLAIPALERVLAQQADPTVMRQLAQQYMDREAYGQAAAVLARLVAQEGAKGDTLMQLATAQYQQADVEAALSTFRQAAVLRDRHAALAQEWVKYLETGKAREQALAAAAERRDREDEAIALSGRIAGGQTVALAAADAASGGGATTRAGGTPRGGLTPVGAEQSANASGEIPAWTGGITADRRPDGFVMGQALPDPYADEQPRFTITADNLSRYADRLTRAHRKLLETLPGYRMPVFTSHRSVAYPDAIYQATAANRERASLEGPDALVGAKLGFPFPQPRTGVEIMWNHRTRYRGDTVDSRYGQAVVQPKGTVTARNDQRFRVRFRYANIAEPADLASENYIALGISAIYEGGRSPDIIGLFHETANSQKQSRNVWVLLTKLGRMLRIPPVGYDQPFPATESMEFIDMVDMYNGAFDRYVWKLVGKRELYIPYNAYRLNRADADPDALLTPRYPDPTDARYELHRVWVIEASERGGKRHAFGKRTFYVDEDSWTVVMVENEDHDGRLWRFQEGHLVAEYDVQAAWTRPVVTYDFKDGRYFINRVFAGYDHFQYNEPMTDSEYLPAVVKRTYTR